MIVYKLLILTTVNISKKNLKDPLNNILEDLNANIEAFQTHSGQKTNRRRIKKLKKFINKKDSEEKQFIENKLDTNSWLKKLNDDQLKNEENYSTFGENFQEFELIGNTLIGEKIRKNPYDNVTNRKIKLLPITSESRLKELPGLYTEIFFTLKRLKQQKIFLIKSLNKYRQLPKRDLKFITITRIISQLTKNEC